MDLLDIARGPALSVAVLIFVAGALWRLLSILRLPRQSDRSPPRDGAPPPPVAALRANARAMWPRRRFGQQAQVTAFNGYVFHLGLALICFGYAPHIAFIQRHLGLSWPALPDAAMALATGATIIALLLALWWRWTDPVRRTISTADDWISWTVTMLPLLTGMAVIAESSAATIASSHLALRGPLALHLLSLELLLIWFPFGKLMHALLFGFARGATGIRLAHRGSRS